MQSVLHWAPVLPRFHLFLTPSDSTVQIRRAELMMSGQSRCLLGLRWRLFGLWCEFLQWGWFLHTSTQLQRKAFTETMGVNGFNRIYNLYITSESPCTPPQPPLHPSILLAESNQRTERVITAGTKDRRVQPEGIQRVCNGAFNKHSHLLCWFRRQSLLSSVVLTTPFL